MKRDLIRLLVLAILLLLGSRRRGKCPRSGVAVYPARVAVRTPSIAPRLLRRGMAIAGLLVAVGILGGALAVDPLVAGQTLAATPCEYWVAAGGSNSNPGTADRPWATLSYAATAVPDAGCTVLVRPGVYTGTASLERRFNTMTTFRSEVPYRAVLQNLGAPVSISGGRNITVEGFEIRHSGPGAGVIVFYIDSSDSGSTWAENIVVRNNVIHDSYNNDLMKVVNGVRFLTVEGNVFYNQGPGEEHIDVNSVTDSVIQDNIFFNDYAGSGRAPYDTKQYIVIKDSGEGADGLLGSERIIVRRNVFLNWLGRSSETWVQMGLDGKPYHEAKDVRVENNLAIGNSTSTSGPAFGVRGARDVVFANNTVAGNLPSGAYALWASTSGYNPPNENILLYNNVWSDPTGTMSRFSSGSASATTKLLLDNNLYWNGGNAIPSGDTANPADDARRIVVNPGLNADQSSVVLPRWNGTAFVSGNASIRQEFERLVALYGQVPPDSPVVGRADPAHAPADDILGRARGAAPDLGAYQPEAGQLPLPSPTPTQPGSSPLPTATPSPTDVPAATTTPAPTATSTAAPSPTEGTGHGRNKPRPTKEPRK